MTTERRTETAIAAPDRTGASTILLAQLARYDYSGPVTNLHQRLVLVPPASHGSQRRSGWRLTVDGVDRWEAGTRVDPFGNLTVEVVVPSVGSWVQFTVESEMKSSVAICWLPNPRATPRATSSSRSESGWGIGAGAATGLTNRSR